MIIVYAWTGVTILAVLIALWGIAAAILRRFDGSYEPGHQAPRLWARSAAGAARAARRALGGARRLPGAKRRQQFTEELDAYGPVMDGLQYRYGTLGDNGPAPLEQDLKTSPAEFPHAAAPLREQEPGTAAAGTIPLVPPPPPQLSHDAFRWPQWYHDQPAVARREATLGSLGAVSAVLVTAAVKAEAWHAEVLRPFPRNEPFASCLSDDTIARGMAAIKDGA